MNLTQEWEFTCWLTSIAPEQAIPRSIVEKLGSDILIDWVEKHHLGTSGGVPYSWLEEPQIRWRVHFFICATREDQFIEKEQAQQLLEYLKNWCALHELHLEGELEIPALE